MTIETTERVHRKIQLRLFAEWIGKLFQSDPDQASLLVREVVSHLAIGVGRQTTSVRVEAGEVLKRTGFDVALVAVGTPEREIEGAPRRCQPGRDVRLCRF